MILFGRKAHHLGLEEDSSENCKKCGNSKIVISVFQKYFHILWLPMFPIKKEAASQCLTCREVLVEKKFSKHHQLIAKELKKKHKSPLWVFVGIFLLLVVLWVKTTVFKG